MNIFLLSEKERLLSWRELRSTMNSLPESLALDEMIRWWAKAPICKYSIDAFDSSSWPTAWVLLNENSYCTSGVAYMMAQTLLLCGWNQNRIELAFIRGVDDERLVLIIDGQLTLNYSYAEVFDWQEVRRENQVLARYFADDLKFYPIS